jgi:ABC-type branched-subunit amino acid transport system substrate-binding protein
MTGTHIRRWVAALAIVVLAAACSTTSSKTSTTSPSNATGTSGDDGPRTASAQGVTADTIKIGYAYIDLETLAESGIIKLDNGPYDEIVKVLVDDINARGGVNGRKLEVVTAKYSPIGDADQLAACTKLTEDEKVFAVLGGLLQQNNLCIVQQHGTILVGGNLNQSLLAKARAPWATGAPSDERAIKALVTLMDDNGFLEGHTVAVYAEGASNKPLVDLAVEALDDAGYEAADTALFDVPNADTQAATVQDKVIAQRFQDKNVDTVINVGLFTPGADWDSVGYYPAIFDLTAGYIQAASFTNPMEKFPIAAGTTATAVPNPPDSPAMRECKAAWKKATGKEILTAQEEAVAGKSSGLAAIGDICTFLQIFVSAAEAAGNNLTQETWQQGLESLGSLPNEPGTPMSFGPGKPDGQDSFQLAKLDPTWEEGSSEPQLLPVGEQIILK